MQSSIKFIIVFLSTIMLCMYSYALSKNNESKRLLIDGRIQVDNETVNLSELLFPMRVFLLFVFCFSALIWLLCFVHVSRPLGIIGVSVAFMDFIVNFEVLGYLAQKPFNESNFNWLSYLFYTIVVANIILYGILIVLALIWS